MMEVQTIVCTGVEYQPTYKYHPLFFPNPFLNLQTIQTPFFIQFPLYIVFFMNPRKNWIFQWTPIILNFLALTPIPSFTNN